MASAGGGWTVIVRPWLAAAPVESFTMIVMELVPAWVGVPTIVTELPVLAPSESPAGSVPEVMLQVNGPLPPLALIVAE